MYIEINYGTLFKYPTLDSVKIKKFIETHTHKNTCAAPQKIDVGPKLKCLYKLVKEDDGFNEESCIVVLLKELEHYWRIIIAIMIPII